MVVVLGLVAAAGLGLRHLRQDPIRYGVAVPPLVNGADYGEAHLVRQVRDSLERTAGPYIGPTPDLSDAALHRSAEALVRLCFESAGWLLGSESRPLLERCRIVTMRYPRSGRIRFSSTRAPCPRGPGVPGAGCTR